MITAVMILDSILYSMGGFSFQGGRNTRHATPHTPQHEPLARTRAAPGLQVLRMHARARPPRPMTGIAQPFIYLVLNP